MSLDNKVELLNTEIKELRRIIAETEKAFANFQEHVNARFKAAQEKTAEYSLNLGIVQSATISDELNSLDKP
ncbi:hypothetical protein [Atlantibacter hermannii]|uniref:hypothetical protein n=1 Tax=Atlantibacter hermannii TaxID=565 RepID=UPI0028A8E6BF|nr:hypothetical protein [Atlantibacter hermannii]